MSPIDDCGHTIAPIILDNHHGDVVRLGFILRELADFSHDVRSDITDGEALEPVRFGLQSLFGGGLVIQELMVSIH